MVNDIILKNKREGKFTPSQFDSILSILVEESDVLKKSNQKGTQVVGGHTFSYYSTKEGCERLMMGRFEFRPLAVHILLDEDYLRKTWEELLGDVQPLIVERISTKIDDTFSVLNGTDYIKGIDFNSVYWCIGKDITYDVKDFATIWDLAGIGSSKPARIGLTLTFQVAIFSEEV